MKRHIIVLVLATLSASIVVFAQEPLSEEEARAKTLENIYKVVETQIERETKAYDLEDWQIFKIDSTLVHDFMAFSDEFAALKKRGVEKSDYYMKVQDKWYEQIYNTYRTILNDEQWEKYLKSGAAKEKKARDRRAAQSEVKKK